MAFYEYRGRNGRGELMQGVLEGADTAAVANQLAATGVVPVQITETKKPKAPGESGGLAGLFAEKVKEFDVQLFSRQMHILLKSGVPLFRGLAGLQESSISKPFIKVLQDLRESLDSGRELSASMRRHPTVFNHFYVSMVRVGEMTGQLEEVFTRLYNHMEFEREMRERVKTALRYPTMVAMAMSGAMVVINLMVIPAFAKVFAGFKTQLPLMTRILLASSNFMINYWPLMLVAVIGSVVGFQYWSRTPNGKQTWDRLKLKLPLAGSIVTKSTLARFARSFALSSRSGVPIVQALTIVSAVVDNAHIGSKVEQMRQGVERGESILRTAVTSGVFTPIVLQMIAVGEETGEIDTLMEDIADMYEREVEYEVKTLSARIEPILLVGLGALVLVLALGIFLPMWDLGRAAMSKG